MLLFLNTCKTYILKKINNFTCNGWTLYKKFFIFGYINYKIDIMYSLDCSYYEKEFNTLDELLDDIDSECMDPNYEITKNGKGTGESVIDLLQF